MTAFTVQALIYLGLGILVIFIVVKVVLDIGAIRKSLERQEKKNNTPGEQNHGRTYHSG